MMKPLLVSLGLFLTVRLGKGLDAWALQTAGIVPMESRGRIMQGWVRCSPEAYGEWRLLKRREPEGARASG